jgi:hypothetical protein
VFVDFPAFPVTENLSSFGVYLPYVRALKEEAEADKDVTALLTTSDDSCAKTNFQELQAATQLACAEGDPGGPFVVGYAVEGPGTGGANPDARGRLIVLGNASFITNQWMYNQDAIGNQQLVQNMINWLAGQEELIAIPPRDPDMRPLNALTGNEINIVLWTSIALIPLAALTIGAFLWWRRR